METDDHPGPDESRRLGLTVVVGIDGSEHARRALKWAADEAKRRGAVLRIIFAQISPPTDTPGWYEGGASDLWPGEAILDDAYALVATRHPSVVANAEIVEWPPALVLTAASRTAELLVVGARGKGGFTELLLGSVSDQCIQYAHCPVAVVHGDPDERPLRAAEPRIVIGVDGSLGSTRALRWALDEAHVRRASVRAIYAWQYPPIGAFVPGPAEGYQAVAREVADAAAEYAQKYAPDVPFEMVMRSGGTVPALLDASRDAEILVSGSRGHGGFHGALLGSVTHQLTRHARCTVLVVRPLLADGQSGANTAGDRPTESNSGFTAASRP